jgi:hypothetical protein
MIYFLKLTVYDIFVSTGNLYLLILAIYDIFVLLAIYAPANIQIVLILQKVTQLSVCVSNYG